MSKLQRLESTIQRTLAEIIRTEVKDSAIGFITITEVRLANDYSNMTIFYTILGGDNKREAAKKALDRSKAFIRSNLAKRVEMRKSPQLIFKYDGTLDYANKINRGLKEVMKDSNLSNNEDEEKS